MSFTYNSGVPNSGNKPSVDQPQMLQNTISINNIWDVNHFSFNQSIAGQHKQLNFPILTNQGSYTPVGQACVVYPAAGITTPSVPQQYLKNSRTTIPMTALRAFAKFTVSPSIAPTIGMQFNVNTIVANGPALNPSGATITLVANAVDSTNVVVMVQAQTNSLNYSYTWSFAGGVLTIVITFTPPVTSTAYQFNFTVLQI